MTAKYLSIPLSTTLSTTLSATLILALAACQRSEAPASAKAKAGGAPAVSVHVVLAKQQEVPVQLQANARVEALSSVELRPQLASTIVKVHVAEGQFVKRGQVLFSLDARTERANFERAKAQLVRDQATLTDLQRQHQRSLELVAKKFVTQSNADTLGSQVEAQRAAVAADQAAMEAAKVALGYEQIRAPQDGRIGEIRVYPGSLVQPTTLLLTLTQMHPIGLGFSVPETDLPAVLAAYKAGAVAVQAKGRSGSGKLGFIDNAVDPQTGLVKLKAQFENQDLQWWPGQYAEVQMTVKSLQAVVVPQAAVINSVKGTFVYQVTPEATAKVMPVKVLYNFGTQSAVSGLVGGEKIIVEGKQNLRPGGKVQVATPGKASGSASANASGNASGRGSASTSTSASSSDSSSANAAGSAPAAAQKGGA